MPQFELPARIGALESGLPDIPTEVDIGKNFPALDNADDIPYGVQSVSDAIACILKENIFLSIFSADERNSLLSFEDVSEKAKLLIVRLFGRSSTLIRMSDVEKILACPGAYLDELVSAGFLTTDVNSLGCNSILANLTRSELEQLAASYLVKDYKKHRMSELLKIMKSLISTSPLGSFFSGNFASDTRFRNQIRRVLGNCWILNREKLRVLTSVLWLYSFGADTSVASPVRAKSIEAYLKTELYTMLLVRRGELIYPPYEIARRSPVYRSYEELHEYLELFDFGFQLEHLMENKNINGAISLVEEKLPYLMELATCAKHRRDDLPVFLRRFTAPYRAARLLLTVVEVFEKQRQYSKAIKVIESLLFTQTPDSFKCPLDSLGPCSVGRFLLRFMVDQGHHLSKPFDALISVEQFLRMDPQDTNSHEQCPCLRSGLRLNVHIQMNKLFSTLLAKFGPDLAEPSGEQRKPKRRKCSIPQLAGQKERLRLPAPSLVVDVKDAPKVEITAPTNASSRDLGSSRPHYLWLESEQRSENAPDETHTLLLTVEQWVIRYYMKHHGFEYGIHTESRVYHLLFTLLFYDILFEDKLPDVFYSYRQAAPLDLFTDDFYSQRRESIDARLEWIGSLNKPISDDDFEDPLAERIKTQWNAHQGERCLWADWGIVDSPDKLIDLFWCIGPAVVKAICNCLAKEYRHWKSGLPDLILWNPRSGRAKILEVKGPGDQLSSQQIMWLDKLVRAGADVEICHVSAVSHKCLQTRE